MFDFDHCRADKKSKLTKRQPKHSTGVTLRFQLIILSNFTEEKYWSIVFQVYLQWPRKKFFLEYFEVIQKISGPIFSIVMGLGMRELKNFLTE